MKKITLVALLPFLLHIAACSGGSSLEETLPEKGTELSAGKGDQWASNDSPTLFSDDLEFDVDDLPLEGEAVNIPWAGSYWPVWKDTINDRWDGSDSMSPAEKYGKAFGHDDFEGTISRYHGIENMSSRKVCTSNSDCDGDTQAAKGKCAKRRGEEEGYCIPTWWGICHAWAPASILEPEPVHPVTRNGVEFKVNDIKALVELMYNRSTSKFLSLRCNENSPDIDVDEYGNPTGDDIECKDTNAGTFHVVVTNYLGIKGEAFVEDRTYDDEVWNQPVSAYRITQMDQVTPKEANELAGAKEIDGSTIEGDTKTVDGEVEKGAWFDAGSFEIPKDAKATVRMETEGDGDLYVRWGSAPNNESYTCRPYNSEPVESCELSAGAVNRKLYVKVYGYEAATFKITVTTEGQTTTIPDAYIWNDEAAKLYHVKLELDYIAESGQSIDGYLGDSIATYTRTDHYQYILEVNDRDEVIGGEWVGSSKKSHPDFLWLPTGRSHQAPAGGKITYAQVKALLDASVAGPGEVDEAAAPDTITESGTVAKGDWKHFGPYEVASGDIEVIMTGTGDADLYVRRGEQPSANLHDCRPYLNGTAETCTTEGPGTFYVSVYGYATSSEFELNISYNADGDSAPAPAPAVETTHLSETGTLERGAMSYFTLEVSAGQKVAIKTQADEDIDLYIKMHQAPTTAAYDKRGYTASGNETINFKANSNGTLHIMVHGYKASDFKLTTSDG
ncbi:MAG: pre-peptidase C-terminal domain-containing protein [Myxococcota bacterium]|nr:pre-peptidase C-terminal domain-containing protein [Myxococcota bacterium]